MGGTGVCWGRGLKDNPGAYGAVQVMLGGAWFRQSFGDPAAAAPELLLGRARAAVREQLGLESPPTRSIVRVHQVGDGIAGWGSPGAGFPW